MWKCREWMVLIFRKLMRLHPMPVVMVSTLTSKGSEVTLKALELGAVILSRNHKLVFVKP